MSRQKDKLMNLYHKKQFVLWSKMWQNLTYKNKMTKGVFQWSTCNFLTFHSLAVTLCTTRSNIQKFYILPTGCIYVFRMDLRINSDYLVCYNQDGECFLHGMTWVFI
jgi:hypothetical protein